MNPKSTHQGTSLVVQWFRLCAPAPAGMGLIPGWGTKTPHDTEQGQKKKKNQIAHSR